MDIRLVRLLYAKWCCKKINVAAMGRILQIQDSGRPVEASR